MLRGIAAFLIASALGAAPAGAKSPPTVERLTLPAFGQAYWTWDGAGFYMAESDERLVRFGLDGKPTANVPLAAVARLGRFNTRSFSATRAAVSPDGRWLLVRVEHYDYDSAVIVDVKSGEARALPVRAVWIDAEWLADGRVLVSQATAAGYATFIVDAVHGQSPAPLCPALAPRLAHGLHDGKRLALAADRLFITDAACRVQATLGPPAKDGEPTLVAFSPSGRYVAAIFMRGPAPAPRLWILSLDGKERVDLELARTGHALVWLDDDNVVFTAPNGTLKMALRRFEWRTRQESPLLPPVESCDDSMPTAPALGGHLLFQRRCDDEKQSGLFLVTAGR
jgi:hypothetical protein